MFFTSQTCPKIIFRTASGPKLPSNLNSWRPKLGPPVWDQFFLLFRLKFYMGVSKNNGTPKSSILIGFSIINHPFWGTPILGNIHIALAPTIQGLIILSHSPKWFFTYSPSATPKNTASYSTAAFAIYPRC